MTIRVYTGTGTSRNGAPLLIEELGKKTSHLVAEIKEDEMRRSEIWKKETSTLIFAGQSVRGFKKALGEDVMNDIQNLVSEGALDYIGICAGAAFASAQIKYRIKEFPLWEEKKIENTGLAFFNGLATGPCRSVSELPFSGRSENLHLITVRGLSHNKSYNAFHWGGPALIPQSTIQGRILSCLQSDGTPLSYRLKHGAGNVTLYSYHPEINAQNIGRWADARQLTYSEASRLEHLASKMDGTAFHHFLSETGLQDNFIVQTEPEPVFAAI